MPELKSIVTSEQRARIEQLTKMRTELEIYNANTSRRKLTPEQRWSLKIDKAQAKWHEKFGGIIDGQSYQSQ